MCLDLFGRKDSRISMALCMILCIIIRFLICLWALSFSISVDLSCLLGWNLSAIVRKQNELIFFFTISNLSCNPRFPSPDCWRVVENWFNILFVGFLFCGSTAPFQVSLKKTLCLGNDPFQMFVYNNTNIFSIIDGLYIFVVNFVI